MGQVVATVPMSDGPIETVSTEVQEEEALTAAAGLLRFVTNARDSGTPVPESLAAVICSLAETSHAPTHAKVDLTNVPTAERYGAGALLEVNKGNYVTACDLFTAALLLLLPGIRWE